MHLYPIVSEEFGKSSSFSRRAISAEPVDLIEYSNNPRLSILQRLND
jgi:hypothetical protein